MSATSAQPDLRRNGAGDDGEGPGAPAAPRPGPAVLLAPPARERPGLRARLRRRIVLVLGFRERALHGAGDAAFLDAAADVTAALTRGEASFGAVARAALLGRRTPVDDAVIDDADREALRAAYTGLVERFELRHGRMAHAYFGRHAFVAATLTDADELSIELGPPGADGALAPGRLTALLRRAEQIAYAAWHRLAPFDRRQCQHMIYGVVLEVLRRLDRPSPGRVAVWNGAGAEAAEERDVARLLGQLDQAEEFMLRCASRRAQLRYLKGMLAGTIVFGVLIGAALGVILALDALTRLAGQLLLVAAAGGLGAVLSVLLRMTSGSFRMNLPTLSHEMRLTDLGLIAALRPLVGIVSALVAYGVLLSGMLPLDQGTALEETAGYATVGFLAGFSERFAQDMFVRSGHGLAGAMGDSPSHGPSAGLAPPPGGDLAATPVRRGRRREAKAAAEQG